MQSKKKKQLNFIIPLVIYPFDVMISINESWDDFAKSVTNKWGADILENFKKYDHPNGEGLSYVYTSESKLCCMLKVHFFENNPNGHGILAHEIFHACEFVLRQCGVKLNSNSHEAYAYLIGYLTTEIYKKIHS